MLSTGVKYADYTLFLLVRPLLVVSDVYRMSIFTITGQEETGCMMTQSGVFPLQRELLFSTAWTSRVTGVAAMNLPALSAICSLPLTHRHLKELALSKRVVLERARGRDQNKNLKEFWLQMFLWFYVEFRKRVLFSVQPRAGGAVIWFPIPTCCLVFLPSPLALSVRSVLLTFPPKILQCFCC